MTIDELKHEVKVLGFDDTIDLSTILVPSANRALNYLYSQKTITKTVRLFTRGYSVSFYKKEIHCENGKSITFPLDGKAFSMRVCGAGSYSVTDGGVTKITAFDTGMESQLVRGFISRGGEIKFHGSFSFTVYDFTIYPEIFSPRTTDIPESGSNVIFDLREMYGDFMSFVSPATDSTGKEIPSCSLKDGKLFVDANYKGEIILTYRRRPATIASIMVDEIDIPEEYCYFFPLLVASYVLLDTDEEKALYYKARYEEMVKCMEKNCYYEIDHNYKNTDGWA